jgi:uncharacterized cupredoxin-like copper-binding protein
MSRALRCFLVTGALLAATLSLVACGGGNSRAGKTPTATKLPTKAVTQQVAGTPTTAAGAQPSATVVATQAPTTPASNTPVSGSGVDVSLREFHVTLSIGTASAGTVTFNVSNDGTIPHDFVVIRTDLDPSALPVSPASLRVDESQVDVVKREAAIHQEASAQVTVDLAAGRYVLICNIADHYQAGMHAAFTVR